MELDELKEGTRIYYGGDMANSDGFGTIVKSNAEKWGQFVFIKMDDGRDINRLTIAAFSSQFLGHGGTRFVTLAAYNAFKRKQVENSTFCKYEYKDAV